MEQFYRNYHDSCGTHGLEKLPIHTGIHAGMVVKARDGDIYGGTVNIASRLELVAGPNEIVLSEAAREKIQSESLELEPMGEQNLKNVSGPVPCFKLA